VRDNKCEALRTFTAVAHSSVSGTVENILRRCEPMVAQSLRRLRKTRVILCAAIFAVASVFSHTRKLSLESSAAPPLRTVKLATSDDLISRKRSVNSNCTVAVVVSSTTRGITDMRWENLALSSIMLPSLKKTLEPEYTYTLYVGVDSDDEFYTSDENRAHLREIANDKLKIVVEFYPRVPNRIPFNEILKRAFEDGNEYIARINDDTQFLTPLWTTMAITELASGTPPNVGVVGPVVQGPKNVNHKILTHDMVHRTHMEIFKCAYYPTVFENAWIDDWITRVYAHRARALWDWKVHHHTGRHGTRYAVKKSLKASLKKEINFGANEIARWIQSNEHHSHRATCDALQQSNHSCQIRSSQFPVYDKLQVVTDVLNVSGVAVIAEATHGDHGRCFRIGSVSTSSEDSNCAILNPSVWIECADFTQTPMSRRGKRTRFCTSNSYVVKFSCVFVEMWGSVHKNVPGTIFDTERAFMHQHYVRSPRTSASTTISAHYQRLATAIFPYLDAPGHFPHETLPKVLWLLQTLPADVPVLAPWTPWTQRYYDALEANGVDTSRIVPFTPSSRSVVSVDTLYTTIEWPYCDQGENPNHGGEPSEYPYEIMSSLRASIVPKSLTSATVKTLLIIDRGKRVRSLIQHAQLVERLKQTYESSGYIVEEFGPAVLDAPLREHIEMFNRAAVVIAPHGAGLSNLIFCREGTAVVEIGFDSSKGMQLDEMYFQLSLGLHLRYWLIMGRGSYVGKIDANVDDVLRVVDDALAGVDPQATE